MFNDPPKFGKGFVYILSNKSMPNLVKVGLTENSVAQRIRELNSTGIPTNFKAEKIFELDIQILRSVERAIHRELTALGMHHGKEFFAVEVSRCVIVAEDVIHRITGSKSIDLVGLAEKRQQDAEVKKIWEAREQLRRETELREANFAIENARQEWIARARNVPVADAETPWYQSLFNFGAVLIGAPLILMILYAFGTVFFDLTGVAIGIVVIAGSVVWMFSKLKEEENDRETHLKNRASTLYPLKTINDIPTRLFEAESSIQRASFQAQVDQAKQVIADKKSGLVVDIHRMRQVFLNRKASHKVRNPSAEWVYSLSTRHLLHIKSEVGFVPGEYWGESGSRPGFRTRDKSHPFIAGDNVEIID